MIKVSAEADRVLVAKVREAAQEHVFQFWEQLNQAEPAALVAQLHAVNLLLVKDLIASALKGTQEVMEDRLLTAAPLLRLGTSEEERLREQEARAHGRGRPRGKGGGGGWGGAPRKGPTRPPPRRR